MTQNEVKKSDFVERTQDHLNHYIAAADSKASILLTGHLAFLGLFGNAIKSGFQDPNKVFLVSTIGTVISLLVAGILALLVILPRTPETPTGYILWTSIMRMDEKEYRNEMMELDGETAFVELTDENYALAKVAKRKYFYLRYSLVVTFAMILLSVTSFTFTVI